MPGTQAIFLVLALLLSSIRAEAGSLRVAPTIIDVPIPGAASTLKLHNSGDTNTTVQVRVFRWTQRNGLDELTQTDRVVVSPPIIAVPPGRTQLVRIVRVSKEQAQGEESYRVLVDEINARTPSNANAVRLTVRHSIPVFFASTASEAGGLEWMLEKKNDELVCVVRNHGGRRVRIASLNVATSEGRSIASREGLVGYVLGQSTSRFPVAQLTAGATDGDILKISALTENGPIKATAPVSVRR